MFQFMSNELNFYRNLQKNLENTDGDGKNGMQVVCGLILIFEFAYTKLCQLLFNSYQELYSRAPYEIRLSLIF